MVFLTITMIVWILYRTIARPLWISLLHPIFLELLNLVEAASVATLVFIWLVLLWRTSRKPPPLPLAPALTVDQLYALSPGDFEAYVGQLFQRKGYTVTLRGRTGDQGVDVELQNKDGKRAIVQCKRYRTTVGSETVRELFGTLIHEKAAHAFLVTTANVSEAARTWAKNKPITLIDGETLVQIATSLQT
ncbi:MAG: restriction endonuclease [Chloroflexota bacterium]